jgi:hypothetical protein
MNFEKKAKDGLEELTKKGVSSVTVSAENVNELRCLSAFYVEMGYEVRSERAVKNGCCSEYPVNLFIRKYEEVSQNA